MKGKIRKLILKTLVILMIGTAIQPTLPAQAQSISKDISRFESR